MKVYPLTTADLEGEIWRDVTDYEGIYKISNLSRLKSLKYDKERIIIPCVDTGVYLRVGLRKDGNKFNNLPENLEWVDGKTNSQRAAAMGLNKVFRGEAHGYAKLTTEQVRYIRRVYIPRHPEFGCAALARKFNVDKSTVSMIVLKKIWRHIL